MNDYKLDFAASAIGVFLGILKEKFTNEEILELLSQAKIQKALEIVDSKSQEKTVE